MVKIADRDSSGRIVYDGMLTFSEIKPYKEFLEYLEKNIPYIEKETQEKYGNNSLYKYHLGLWLRHLIFQNNISEIERRKLWNEIKYCSNEERSRQEGKNSKTRKFYEQCYLLSLVSEETAKRYTWRQWQSLFDRVAIREDERLFEWIENQKNKINEKDWRSFQKILHAFLKKKNTSVFGEEELFKIYDSFLDMASVFNTLIKSKAVKNESIVQGEYIRICFELRKLNKKELDVKECQKSFEKAITQ